jgi:hypothetical protein
MAESSTVRTKQDAIITISDGTTTYTVSKEAGDFQTSTPRFNVTSVLDRGLFTNAPTLRKGDEQPITFGFSAYLRDFGNATSLTLHDLCNDLSGTVAAGMTGRTSDSDVKTWLVTYTVDGTWNGEADQGLQFDHCFLTASIQEGDPSVITISGTSYQSTPTLI